MGSTYRDSHLIRFEVGSKVVNFLISSSSDFDDEPSLRTIVLVGKILIVITVMFITITVIIHYNDIIIHYPMHGEKISQLIGSTSTMFYSSLILLWQNQKKKKNISLNSFKLYWVSRPREVNLPISQSLLIVLM